MLGAALHAGSAPVTRLWIPPPLPLLPPPGTETPIPRAASHTTVNKQVNHKSY